MSSQVSNQERLLRGQGRGISTHRPGRWSAATAAGLLAVLAGSLAGQELPLKRTLPAPSPGGCAALPPFRPEEPTTVDADEADRLAAAAAQAAILGDQEGARDFLERASQLDETDEAIAYDLARTYDALGRTDDAVAAYCRFLTLAPGSSDASDVGSRVTQLSPPDPPLAPSAIDAFQEGVRAVDAGELDDALRAFSGALDGAPDLAPAVYNRALVHSLQQRYDLAIEDYRAYLDMDPGASDSRQVLERIGTLRSPPDVYSPATAFVAGLFIPGFGQFHTDRPVGGLLVLTTALGAAGFGLLYTETEVLCATPQDPCPPNQILDETETRPYLAAGLGVAAGVTLIAAIEGLIKAKRLNAEAASMVGAGRPSSPGGLTFLPPSARPAPGGGLALELVRVRF